MTPEDALGKIEPMYMGMFPRHFYSVYELDPSRDAFVGLHITDFGNFKGHPIYEELFGVVMPDNMVVDLAAFYPYGRYASPDEWGRGLGSAVMETIVQRECERYDARLLHCATREEPMQRLLGKYGFDALEAPCDPPSFYRILQ